MSVADIPSSCRNEDRLRETWKRDEQACVVGTFEAVPDRSMAWVRWLGMSSKDQSKYSWR